MDSDRRAAWFRALRRFQLAGENPTWRVAGYYTFDSKRTGERYEIRRVEGARELTYTCTCPAAVTHNVCWHMAGVASLPYESALRKRYVLERRPAPRHFTPRVDPLTDAMS